MILNDKEKEEREKDPQNQGFSPSGVWVNKC
jgi:hypothetical protein